jgi:hypothetical protein
VAPNPPDGSILEAIQRAEIAVVNIVNAPTQRPFSFVFFLLLATMYTAKIVQYELTYRFYWFQTTVHIMVYCFTFYIMRENCLEFYFLVIVVKLGL